MSSNDEFDDLDEGKNDIELESQSDIKSDENYSDDDYYNDKNEEYKKVEPLPSIAIDKPTLQMEFLTIIRTS